MLTERLEDFDSRCGIKPGKEALFEVA